MIIKTNLNDLRDVTHNIHYETYRYKKLSSFNANESKNGKTLQTPSLNKFVFQIIYYIFLNKLFVYRNLLSQIEDERMETEARLDKMSRDMENVYQSKVEEKLQKLEENKQNVRFGFFV
jgi:septin family protein